MKKFSAAAIAMLVAFAFPALAAGPSPERQARYEQWCQANPEKCREMQAWREQCRADPEKCRAEMQARREARRAQCRADPERCRAEWQARIQTRFNKADANGDGGISREEAASGVPMVARHFDRIDTNQDGLVTMEELQAARNARVMHRQQPGGRHWTAPGRT